MSKFKIGDYVKVRSQQAYGTVTQVFGKFYYVRMEATSIEIGLVAENDLR